MPTRPNLLFVFADQLRARELEDPAHPLETPAFDRLCAEGTRFANAATNCPVCTPARAMLLTGQYPLTSRVVANDLPLPADAVTMGSTLRAAGYRTGYIGKWHLDGVPRARFTPPGPRRHGFDSWAVHNCTHAYLQSTYYRDSPEPLPIPGYEPVFQTDLALDFLRAPASEPFCLFLSWGPPHDPYHALPPADAARYDPARIAYPANFLRDDPAHWPPGRSLQPLLRQTDPRQALAHYYGHITALDRELGRLLAELDRLGLADNTLVVYTSDHGDMLWSHGRQMKQQPWDEAVRIPLVVRWPGHVPAASVHAGCVSLVDLPPTLLAALGVTPPPTMEGRELSGALFGVDPQGPESAFLLDLVVCDQSWVMQVPAWRGVRTRRHTYARTHEGAWVLYDNLADPDQLANLVGQPAHAALQAALEAELQAWLDRTSDAFETDEAILRRLGLTDLWNARERELWGERARLL
jgi:arylsulfatase A-like enzyme